MRRHRDARRTPGLRVPVLCCLSAVVALSLGPTGEAAVRAGFRDAAKPGFLLAQLVAARLDSCDFARWPWSSPSETPRPSPSSAGSTAAVAEARALRAELAAARHELSRFETSLGPVRAASGEAATVDRIAARLLAPADGGGFLVAAGTASGVHADAPVTEPLSASAGTADGVAAGAEVLAGAAVVGRTAEVGAWTSTVLSVTDAAFKAHVWIVRETAGGPVFGEEGILQGDGRGGCVVRYVPSTAAVAAGDHVYSRDPTGRLPQPLYYGRITRAELPDGAPHWELSVRPAADVASLASVHILRTNAESPRLLGN